MSRNKGALRSGATQEMLFMVLFKIAVGAIGCVSSRSTICMPFALYSSGDLKLFEVTWIVWPMW